MIPIIGQTKPPNAQQKLELYHAGLSEQLLTFGYADDYTAVDENIKRYHF